MSEIKDIVGMKVEEIDWDEYGQFMIDFVKGKERIRLHFPNGSDDIEVIDNP